MFHVGYELGGEEVYFWKAFHSLSNKSIYFCQDSSKVSPSGGEWLDLLVSSNLKLGALVHLPNL